MSVEKADRWISLLGNLAVLVGILLVMYELSQNRAAIEAQTRNEIGQEIVTLMSQVAGDPGLAKIISDADRGAELPSVAAFQYLHRTS